MARYFFLNFLLSISIFSSAQEITQSLRGQVSDQISLKGIPSVSVVLNNGESSFITITDEQGNFTLEELPLGRYIIRVTHISYNPYIYHDVILSAGKAFFLQIELKPAIRQLKNIEIQAGKSMFFLTPRLSSLSIDMEMSDRIPATFYDPARIVTSYPGIAIQNDQSNNISIRGNSPNELTWRIDGLNFVNPNHLTNAGTFSDRPSVSGGGVSILSAQLIQRSRILTGAFPANYGNALSGVFDIRLKEGNHQNSEFTLQAGLLGIEASAEGPLSKHKKHGYLINYRYSTIGLLSQIGVDLGDESIDFQDLSFNLVFDLKDAGTLTVFGIGGLSNEKFIAKNDSTKWETLEDRVDTRFNSDMGGIGITHQVAIGDVSSWSNKLSYSYISSIREGIYVFDDYSKNPIQYDQFDQALLSINSEFNTTSNDYLLKVGLFADRQSFNLLSQSSDFYQDDLQETIKGIGSYWIHQPYVQIEKPLNIHWKITAGINGLYHSLRGKLNLSPRVGISYYPDDKRSFQIHYGWVSKSQIPQAYYVFDQQSGTYPNKDLDFTRSHQVLFGYEQMINEETQIKFEGYVQKHIQVPVSPDPGNPYSLVNAQDAFVDEILTNQGTARNIGVEVILERNFVQNYYVLLAGSLYNSTYKALDKIRRNTRYNGQYGLNITAGKEFIKLKKSSQRIFGINARFLFHGGPWDTPIDEMLSKENQYPVYAEAEAFTIKQKDYFRIDLGLYFKKNKKNYTRSIILGVQNITNRKNIAYQFYDPESNNVRTKYQLGIVPSLSYRIQF